MAITPNGFSDSITDAGNYAHYCSFFQNINDRLADEITKKIKKIKGIDEGSKYNVEINFDRDYNQLRPKFYYIIQVKKTVFTGDSHYGNIDEYEHFMFTLSSKKPHDHDATLKELLYEFGDLLDGFVEKLLLAEELFDRYNIHINEDMDGIDIEVDGEGYDAKYKLTKTPQYEKTMIETSTDPMVYKTSAMNTKDHLVSLIVDDWMTLDEMKTVIDLVYE